MMGYTCYTAPHCSNTALTILHTAPPCWPHSSPQLHITPRLHCTGSYNSKILHTVLHCSIICIPHCCMQWGPLTKCQNINNWWLTPHTQAASFLTIILLDSFSWLWALFVHNHWLIRESRRQGRRKTSGWSLTPLRDRRLLPMLAGFFNDWIFCKLSVTVNRPRDGLMIEDLSLPGLPRCCVGSFPRRLGLDWALQGLSPCWSLPYPRGRGSDQSCFRPRTRLTSYSELRSLSW